MAARRSVPGVDRFFDRLLVILFIVYKADTHWDQFGAYVGYRAIMGEVSRALPDKQLVILGPPDFQRFPDQRGGGDLTDIVGVSEEFKEQLMTMTPRVEVSVPVGPHEGHIAEIVLDQANQQLPRAGHVSRFIRHRADTADGPKFFSQRLPMEL